MTDKSRHAWLYEVGLIESVCFNLADEKLYWYKALKNNRFVWATWNASEGTALKRCRGPI